MPVAEPVSAVLTTAEQYLHMSFEHDAEFVEGNIVERPMPTWEYSCVQIFLTGALSAACGQRGFFVGSELRFQLSPDRFRVPDVCVLSEKPSGVFGRRHLTTPPYLCVEILSPEDSMVDMLAKAREYQRFGATWVWIIDPVTCSGQIYGPGFLKDVTDKVFSTDRFSVDLSTVEL